MIRATLFEQLGEFEDRFRLMFEDQTFFAKALAFRPAYVSSKVWAKYRQHPDSCSAQSEAAGTTQSARLEFLRWLNASMKNKTFPIRLAIWKSLATALYSNARRELKRSISGRS